MLSELESFKAGFLTRCVEEGLSTDEALSRVKSASDRLDAMEKQAINPVYNVAKDVGGFASGLISPLVKAVVTPHSFYQLPGDSCLLVALEPFNCFRGGVNTILIVFY